MKVVVVESPAKAKSISRYLGKDFAVLSTYGHVRDLAAKEGSVDPEKDFQMLWEVSSRGKKQLKDISTALKDASAIYLATDPDREGEAIAWHVCEALSSKIKSIPVHRSVFHQVTKKAVCAAIDSPRSLNMQLVNAYLARRALDYLVGFGISPILWRKLPGSRSAGRVQSVALRLISERESEIERFKSEEYWTIEGVFTVNKTEKVIASLVEVKGAKLEKLSIANKSQAQDIVAAAEKEQYQVESFSDKSVSRRPYPPFITSTLQQEASRKLNFSTSQTMQLAQKLYEGIDISGENVGLITYMRTDSVSMDEQAIQQARVSIDKHFGKTYVPSTSRHYQGKVKNAQEAHEAIRPTDFSRHPNSVRDVLDDKQFKLYELIWKRAIASQMADASFKRATAVFRSSQFAFKAVGTRCVFDGFLAAYREEDKEKDKFLPILTEGQDVSIDDTASEQHFTQPPPRYTEAGLVKQMEKLGIGRPSTYASIIQILQTRSYVELRKKAFYPTDRGRLVSCFLEKFFAQYVEYDFTAHMEDILDQISSGEGDWKDVLKDFWFPFKQHIGETEGLKISDVLDVLDDALAAHFFDALPTGELNRQCPGCGKGTLHIKLGRYGGFLGCSAYPSCAYTKKFDESSEGASSGPIEFGQDAEGCSISLKKGPYGFYVQRSKEGKSLKRVAVPKQWSTDTVDKGRALFLLELPKVLGEHPNTQEDISIGIGRFGPYVKHGKKFHSVKNVDLFDISYEKAVHIVDNT